MPVNRVIPTSTVATHWCRNSAMLLVSTKRATRRKPLPGVCEEDDSIALKRLTYPSQEMGQQRTPRQMPDWSPELKRYSARKEREKLVPQLFFRKAHNSF